MEHFFTDSHLNPQLQSRINWIRLNNSDILSIDYKLLSEDEIKELFIAVIEFINSRNHPILLLSDFTDVPVNSPLSDYLKIKGKQINQEKIIRSAALGITGIKAFLANAYLKFSGSRAQFFKNKLDAITYLTNK